MAKNDKQTNPSIVTPLFRVGYIQMPDDDDGDGRYHITAIFDGDANTDELEELVLSKLKEAHGLKKFKKGYTNPLKDGDARYKDNDRKEFKGATYTSLKTKFLPSCIDESGKKSKNADINDSGYLYSGAYFKAIVDCYSYDSNKGNDAGIGVGVHSLLKVKDGEKLGGGGMSAEAARDKFDAASRGDEPKKKKGKGDPKPKPKEKTKKNKGKK